jgi:hypothetical protein
MMKIYLFQKNELDIIEEWIEYHSKIVGYDGIVIVDHMSDDGSYQLIEKYINRGLTLIKYKGPYTNKGKVLSNYIRKYPSEIVIPLDADEFVVYELDGTIISDPLKVREELLTLLESKSKSESEPDQKHSSKGRTIIESQKRKKSTTNNKTGRYIFGFIYNLVNLKLYPEKEDLKYFEKIDFTKPTNELGKSFFRSSCFISTDLGNHWGKIKTDTTTKIASTIGLLHYKVRGVPHYSNKTKKSGTAFNFSKKGSSSSSGKHWRIDYDAYHKSGAEKGFETIHLYKGDINDLTIHQLFPLPTPTVPLPTPTVPLPTPTVPLPTPTVPIARKRKKRVVKRLKQKN